MELQTELNVEKLLGCAQYRHGCAMLKSNLLFFDFH